MLMHKLEQLHLKLEHLQPVAKDCGGVGSTERSAPYGDITHEQESGRRLARQLPTQNVRSSIPNQASTTTCFHYGEAGHIIRECSRSPSSTSHEDILTSSKPEAFERPMSREDQLPTLQLGRTTKRASLQIEMTVNGLPIKASLTPAQKPQ